MTNPSIVNPTASEVLSQMNLLTPNALSLIQQSQLGLKSYRPIHFCNQHEVV